MTCLLNLMQVASCKGWDNNKLAIPGGDCSLVDIWIIDH